MYDQYYFRNNKKKDWEGKQLILILEMPGTTPAAAAIAHIATATLIISPHAYSCNIMPVVILITSSLGLRF